MTKREGYYPSNDGMTRIGYTVWLPEGRPAGILQIAHGMAEHIGRYDRFACFLAEHGWLVAGNDHIGHGRSVRSEEDLGFFRQPDGLGCALEDMHSLRKLIREEWPEPPYFLMGHSMGSFLARAYLQQYGQGLSGCIIMGTGNPPAAVVTAGLVLCQTKALAQGWRHRSKQVESIAIGSYNKSIPDPRTPCDWLTRDTKIVDEYIASPLCGFTFTLNGFDTLFSAIGQAISREGIRQIPKDLPLLLVSGEKDPVGGMGKEVRLACDALKNEGLRNVDLKLYPEDRHEILNELDHDRVDGDLLAWLTGHLPR